MVRQIIDHEMVDCETDIDHDLVDCERDDKINHLPSHHLNLPPHNLPSSHHLSHNLRLYMRKSYHKS